MVLVRVGEQHGLDPIGVLTQVGEVREDQIDARHVGVGKHDPAVDDQDPAVNLEAEAVPADLAGPAEKYDPDRHQPSTLQRPGPPPAPPEVDYAPAATSAASRSLATSSSIAYSSPVSTQSSN